MSSNLLFFRRQPRKPSPGRTRSTFDTYTREGAIKLAEMVCEYWHARGHTEVEAVAWAPDDIRNHRVSTNLVDALPPAQQSPSQRARGQAEIDRAKRKEERAA